MFGCNTICPKCRHEFTCCHQQQSTLLQIQSSTTSGCCCCNNNYQQQRSMHVLSGGGLINQQQQSTMPPSSILSISPLSPQISPSVPLSFIIPPPMQPIQQQIVLKDAVPEVEYDSLVKQLKTLKLSGWFYENLTYETSNNLLKDTKIGTFLLRNSSDPRFLFSLSVQTQRGPTSVRLYYINGYYRLDAQQHLQQTMPMFSNVISLIEYYIGQSYLCKINPQVWVDNQGKWYSSIQLIKPLIKKQQPRSLKHLSRLVVNKQKFDQNIDLPNSLQVYLAEYPHSI